MYTLNLNGRLVDLSTPRVMAVINVTPDSFYTSCKSDDAVVDAALRAVDEGADLLDLGGMSTRPGAEMVDEEEELRRLTHAAGLIRKRLPDVPLSVDTFRARVAARMVGDYGACMINDISGGEMDKDMFQTVAETGAAYVLTHMRGTPQTMQQHTDYKDLLSEVIDFMQRRVDRLRELGVHDIILDPGFCFAKTLEQNYELLAKLDYLDIIGHPVLAGLSHKSMLFRLLDSTPDRMTNATTAANVVALMHGACILRVHEVREAVEAVRIVEAVRRGGQTD